MNLVDNSERGSIEFKKVVYNERSQNQNVKYEKVAYNLDNN
jgi:hypothetical protein